MSAAAPAPAPLGPAAIATYTLDYNDTNEVVINGVPEINKESSKRSLASLPSLSGDIYGRVDQLIQDQKTWNYLDALKDGTNKYQLDDLEIYKGINLPFSEIYRHENNLLTRNKGNILRTTWLKTKKNSKMNLVDADDVFWEAGLGYEPFIQLVHGGQQIKEIVTFGSYIDPLTKPGEIWPPPEHKIYITPRFMEAFGFGPSSLWAITKTPTLVTKTSGASFEYEIKINCGKGCADNIDKCKLNHIPKNIRSIDDNNFYFKGNAAKNDLVNRKKGPSITSADKTKLIVAKGWGDKVQVMLYYMYYYIKNKYTIMITCDLVVFCFCITLNIPCVYTGVYDRDIDIPHNAKNVISPDNSFFSILHFKPGSPHSNALTNYDNTITKIKSENEDFITNISNLMTNFNTGIEVGDTNPITFQQIFYQKLYKDMLLINQELESNRNRMNGVNDNEDGINRIVSETYELKKKYLIIPMFKYTGKDKIRFLQTKFYTSEKSITLTKENIGNKLIGLSFLQFAKTHHNSNYGKTPEDALKGGGNKKDMIMYRKAQEDRKLEKWHEDLARSERVIKRQAGRDQRKIKDDLYNNYMTNDNLKLKLELKQQFPNRDVQPKYFRACIGDMDDIENNEYINEKSQQLENGINIDADLFLFDDIDEEIQFKETPIKERGANIQYKFDIEILSAIEHIYDSATRGRAAALNSGQQDYVALHGNVVNEQAGGRRRNATRRRQKGGSVDETLFETLYTLYVYRAQYDIELDTPDHSINMKVLTELYDDYPTSDVQPIRNNTRRQVKDELVNGGPAPTVTYNLPGNPSVNMSKLVTSNQTGSPTYNVPENQLIESQVTGMIPTNISNNFSRKGRRTLRASRALRTSRVSHPLHTGSGRITRRKKKHHRRTRK